MLGLEVVFREKNLCLVPQVYQILSHLAHEINIAAQAKRVLMIHSHFAGQNYV